MKKILYFDLEWVPVEKDLDTVRYKNPVLYDAWVRRYDKFKESGKLENYNSPEEYFDAEAGFYPEFIKIIVGSFGYYSDNGQFKVDSIHGDDELEVLTNIKKLLDKVYGHYKLCGHGIKRYDMPYLAKRMAINGLKVPHDLNNGNKKPWEIDVVDTSELWSFGCNQKKYTPLDWICAVLDVPTSKSDISGKDVKKAYYEEGRLNDIKDYCERDVEVTAQVERKINNFI